MATPINVVVFKCRKNFKFVRRKIGEIVRYLPHKKQQQNFVSLSNFRYCADQAKIYQIQPHTFGSHCSRFHPNRFTFGGVIAERVNTVLLPRGVFPIFAFGRIKIVSTGYYGHLKLHFSNETENINDNKKLNGRRETARRNVSLENYK